MKKAMTEQQARTELKGAYQSLWALVASGAAEQDKRLARRKVSAKHWQVFELTGRVDDMPPQAGE